MGEKSDKDLRPFSNACKFRQEKKTTETFNKDSEDFCEKKVRRPVNVNNDITYDHPNDKTDVS